MLLNLGTDFSLPEEQWKDLANRIEEIITGQDPLFPCSEKIEVLASRYARKVVHYCGKEEKEVKEAPPEYQRVDIDSIDHGLSRTVGAEHVVYETFKALGLQSFINGLVLNKGLANMVIGVIAARLIAPSSERAAHRWLQEMSAIGELLEADFSELSLDSVYKAADILLHHRDAIEEYLRYRERNLFNLEEQVILYDLTNTFFEGSGKYNKKARFGPSKEKRSDCPLVTLGLVLDADGFPKRSRVFEGNVGEAGTLPGMINALSFEDGDKKPLVVMDAGIATQENIDWLRQQDFGYIVVSRKRSVDVFPEAEMVTVRQDEYRLIRAAFIDGPDEGEVTLCCHSTAKEIKESGIRKRFQDRLEEELVKIKDGLLKKGCLKQYDKVTEKIGRLRERYKRISGRYTIEVTKDEKTDKTASISWERRDPEKPSGVYALRSNRVDLTEQAFFDIFTMLTDIEDAFRAMKSTLGLRPVFHQKEYRADGHLFITVLAYHILHTIRLRLRKQGIHDGWSTIRSGLSNHTRCTVMMRRDDGKMIHIRRSGRPELYHRKIYDALGLSHRPGKTVKTVL
jgi:transposase